MGAPRPGRVVPGNLPVRRCIDPEPHLPTSGPENGDRDVVDDDTLLDAAITKAHEIMRNTPFGVALTKEGMWSALEIPALQNAIDLENRQQIMASATADHREALMAFLERRSPNYTNE